MLGVLSVGQVKGNPRDFLVFGDTLLLFSLDVESELFVADVVLSGRVWLGFLLSGDLSEHNWALGEFVVEFDGSPFRSTGSFSSFEPSAVWQFP